MATAFRKLLRAFVGIAAAGGIAHLPAAAGEPDDQAVIVHLKLADSAFGATGESFALYDVEDAIERAIGAAGRLDGHRIGGGYFTLFAYGRDADELFGVMRPELDSPLIRPGSYVLIRRGGPETPADRVDLKP